jgi:gamma-butyrobetaine dioxygenase
MLRRIVPFISRYSTPAFSPHLSNIRSRSIASIGETSLSVSSIGVRFPYQWLRDSCQCSECIDPSTRQKLRNTLDVNPEIRPTESGIDVRDDGVNITWNTGHRSFYTNSFLHSHSSRHNLADFHKEGKRQTWNTKEISEAQDLFLSYASLKTQKGLLDAINQLANYGILFVSGVPNQETADNTCELRTLAGHFGEIRETFYGVLFDVKNVKNSINIAYTNLNLGLHMDLL